MKDELAPDFLKQSKRLFDNYNKQSNRITTLFTQISNRFPQSSLKEIYEKSKGAKLSKGYNLGGYPYQVLDLFRNFDEKEGFNIRILAWWGNGFYVFITYGSNYAKNNISAFTRLHPEFLISTSIKTFDYSQIIYGPHASILDQIGDQIKSGKVIQVWLELNVLENNILRNGYLENLVGRLLDIHS